MDVTVTMLRILLVEDSQADAELVLRQLRELPRAFEHLRVASETGLRAALADFRPDVILSDFRMPGFSGQQALEIVMTLAPAVPFLFVSGTIGEELAIDTLQKGAVDYVLKDNLRRLPNAIERALDIAHSRHEREQIEHALRDSEERFRTIVESSNDWIWECDLDTRVTYSNSAVQGILGYTPRELSTMPSKDLLLAEDRGEVVEKLKLLAEAGQGWQGWHMRWHHRDGSVHVLESTGSPRFNKHGKIIGFRGIAHDITERLNQEAQIRHLARIHSVLGALGNAILRAGSRSQLLQQICEVAVDKGGFIAACISELAVDGRILALTHSFGDLRLAEFVASLGPMATDDPAGAAGRPALRALQEQKEIIIRNYADDPQVSTRRRADMAQIGVGSQICLPIGNPAWAVMGLYAHEPQNFDDEELELLQHLTGEIDYAIEFMAKSERLEFLAYHNPVSGLYNRVAFLAKLQELMQGRRFSVAVVDISDFSAINESRGRAFGDLLLHRVGQRLRELFSVDTLLAHPEADSFALAYPSLGDVDADYSHLESLIREFGRRPFVFEGEEVHIDLHGGLALAPEHGESAETVEQNALSALFEGRRRDDRVHVFSEELRGRATRRLKLETDLHVALENQQFELHYQPKFDAATHRVVGAEALLRWNHPERGLVPPAEFIPVLERTHMILPVGQWIMREALRTARAWRSRQAGMRIAVNVSSRELRHARFIAECTALLKEDLDASLLDIEITESLLMDDLEQSTRILQALRDLGCRIAVDDFGTGYSSLNYLVRLPVDTIKIDQSFVALMTQSPETMGLVSNIINLGHSLSLQIVAEGVEEEEQMKLLRLLRCDVLQGYLMGRPLPEAEFAQRYIDFSA